MADVNISARLNGSSRASYGPQPSAQQTPTPIAASLLDNVVTLTVPLPTGETLTLTVPISQAIDALRSQQAQRN